MSTCVISPPAELIQDSTSHRTVRQHQGVGRQTQGVVAELTTGHSVLQVRPGQRHIPGIHVLFFVFLTETEQKKTNGFSSEK